MMKRLLLQKYLTVMFSLGLIVSGGFLFYSYYLDESTVLPARGGQLEIAQLAPPPLLSPLSYGTDDRTNLFSSLLFRSMMRVDLSSRELTGDLSTCEFGRANGEVACTLISSGALWSDGTLITREDVLESYVLYREKAKSLRILEILSRTSIAESSDGRIIFRNPNRPKEIYELLTLPILSQAEIKKGDNISITPDFPVSGPLKLSSRSSDETLGTTQFLFARNDAYQGTGAFSERMRVTFYNDNETEFARQIADIDIILPSAIMGSENQNAFKKVSINIPELATFFTNTQTLPVEWRTAFVQAIAGLSQGMTGSYTQGYPKDIPQVLTSTGWTYTGALQILRDGGAILGMYPRDTVLTTLRDRLMLLQREINTPIEPLQSNTYLHTPTSQKVYAATGTFVIRGSTPAGTTHVVINGFRLTEFGGKDFSYRASRDISTLKLGKNTYTVRFEKNGRLLAQETLTVDLFSDLDAYSVRSKEIYSAYHPEEVKELFKKQESTLAATIASIEALPGHTLVNEAGKLASIHLARLEGLEFDEIYVAIQALLKQAGYQVESKEMTIAEIQEGIKAQNPGYDIVFAGIYIGKDGKELFSFLHHRGIAAGFNFALVNDNALNLALSELKELSVDSDRFVTLSERIAQRIRELGVLAPVSLRSQSLFVHSNLIKNSGNTSVFSMNYSDLLDIKKLILSSAVNAEYLPKKDTKSISGFVGYLARIFQTF